MNKNKMTNSDEQISETDLFGTIDESEVRLGYETSDFCIKCVNWDGHENDGNLYCWHQNCPAYNSTVAHK